MPCSTAQETFGAKKKKQIIQQGKKNTEAAGGNYEQLNTRGLKGAAPVQEGNVVRAAFQASRRARSERALPVPLLGILPEPAVLTPKTISVVVIIFFFLLFVNCCA